MSNLTFRCFQCNKVSSMDRPADQRDKVDRLRDVDNSRRSLFFYCDYCGTANELPVTPEAMLQFLFGRKGRE
jgi:hypothetical protein